MKLSKKSNIGNSIPKSYVIFRVWHTKLNNEKTNLLKFKDLARNPQTDFPGHVSMQVVKDGKYRYVSFRPSNVPGALHRAGVFMHAPEQDEKFEGRKPDVKYVLSKLDIGKLWPLVKLEKLQKNYPTWSFAANTKIANLKPSKHQLGKHSHTSSSILHELLQAVGVKTKPLVLRKAKASIIRENLIVTPNNFDELLSRLQNSESSKLRNSITSDVINGLISDMPEKTSPRPYRKFNINENTRPAFQLNPFGHHLDSKMQFKVLLGLAVMSGLSYFTEIDFRLIAFVFIAAALLYKGVSAVVSNKDSNQLSFRR